MVSTTISSPSYCRAPPSLVRKGGSIVSRRIRSAPPGYGPYRLTSNRIKPGWCVLAAVPRYCASNSVINDPGRTSAPSKPVLSVTRFTCPSPMRKYDGIRNRCFFRVAPTPDDGKRFDASAQVAAWRERYGAKRQWRLRVNHWRSCNAASSRARMGRGRKDSASVSSSRQLRKPPMKLRRS